MPNQNQIAWDAMMGKKYQQGKSVKSNIEADRADLIEGRMTGEEFRRRHGEYKPDLTGATDLMKPKKRLYFHPKTGKKITKAEYDKYLSKAKGGKIKYQEGGPAKRAQAAWEKSTGKKMKTTMTDAETILSLIMGTMGGGKMPFKGGYGPIKGTIAKGAYTRDPSHIQREAAKILKKHKDVIDKATKSSDKIRNKKVKDISSKEWDMLEERNLYRPAERMGRKRPVGATGPDHPMWGTPGVDFAKGGKIDKKKHLEKWSPNYITEDGVSLSKVDLKNLKRAGNDKEKRQKVFDAVSMRAKKRNPYYIKRRKPAENPDKIEPRMAQGGQVPQMEAVKRLVEMWKPKTKEGKLYDDQLARAVMALGGQVPEYGLGGSLLGGMLGKGKSVMGLPGGPAGLALSKLFGGKQQKGGMSAKQLAQQKMAEAQTEGLAEGTQDANRENIMNALMYSTPPAQMNPKEKGMFEQGGEVPEGRRMYGTNPRRKKYPMQTSTAGMPVRGETYKKGGKVKMPKGWHV